MSTKQNIESVQGSHQRTDLFERWVRIMNKMSRSESLPRDFGTGNLLFPSEIHTLCVLGTMPGIRITDFSVRLGVTKGAISKIAKKMEETGFIEKYRKPGNDKEILIRLTPKGKKAYRGHEEYHKKAFGRIIKEMENFTEEQTAFLVGVFDMVEEVIDINLPEKESIDKADTIQEKKE
jgi:DNA-binding MarR family transcriptional regulator